MIDFVPGSPLRTISHFHGYSFFVGVLRGRFRPAIRTISSHPWPPVPHPQLPNQFPYMLFTGPTSHNWVWPGNPRSNPPPLLSTLPFCPAVSLSGVRSPLHSSWPGRFRPRRSLVDFDNAPLLHLPSYGSPSLPSPSRMSFHPVLTTVPSCHISRR